MGAPRKVKPMKWRCTEDAYWRDHPVEKRNAVERLLRFLSQVRPEAPVYNDRDSPIGRFYLTRIKRMGNVGGEPPWLREKKARKKKAPP